MEDIKGKNILVVDNNATCRRVFSEYLTSLGCRFDKADNGEDALDKLIKARQRNDRFSAAIIAVTANAMKGDRERFLAAGMDDYIAKPIKKADLAAVIARCMKSNGLKAEGR